MYIKLFHTVSLNITENKVRPTYRMVRNTRSQHGYTYEQTIVNLGYHSVVLVGLNTAYAMIAKSLLKMKPIELGKMDLSDAGKLVGIFSLSLFTRDYLVKQKIIPADINV